MRPRDLLDLLLLAALWGGSFLFVRAAVPAFGPFALIELRVGIAALMLLPLLALRGSIGELRRNAAPIAVVGLMNSALPFTLFAFASLTMTAGFAAILNATAPLFGALVAHIWLKDRLTRVQGLGLLIGFGGVLLLVWSRTAFAGGGSSWAVAAALCATLAYGIAANYTKRTLTGVSSLSIATGSQCTAALALLPLALWAWPIATPPLRTWLEVILLGVGSTGVAYLLYFRLIASVGPTRAVSVTFLVPVFGMLWGALYLGETVTLSMLLGCGVILLGTALTLGLLRPSANARPRAGSTSSG
jgi:drug/metabolite transporter (DMT)-like permease